MSSPEQNLWIAVAAAAVQEHKARIEVASDDKPTWAYVSAELVPLLSRPNEIAAARRYFNSRDWREVVALAGLPDDTAEAALAYVTSGTAGRAARRKALKNTYARLTTVKQKKQIEQSAEKVMSRLQHDWAPVVKLREDVRRELVLKHGWEPGDDHGHRTINNTIKAFWPYAKGRNTPFIYCGLGLVGMVFKSAAAEARWRAMDAPERAKALIDTFFGGVVPPGLFRRTEK